MATMFLWGVIGILTARTLSVEDRGVYASAIIVSGVIAGIASMGSASGFFVSNRRLDPGEVASNGMLVSFPLSVALAAGFAAFGRNISQADSQVILLASLGIAPAMWRGILGGVLQGSGQFFRFNVATQIPTLFVFIALFFWLVVMGHRDDKSALTAWCVAQYVSVLPFVVWGRQWAGWFRHHRPDPLLVARMLRFSAVTGFAGIIGVLNYRIDQILVIRLDSEQGAGIYSSAIAVAEGLWLFSSAIALASFHRVGRASSEEAASITATGVRHTLLVVVLGGGAAAIIGPVMLEVLFGKVYGEAADALRVLCIGTALFAPQGLLNNYFVNQLGRPSFPLIAGTLSLAISVIVGFLLIPDHGTVGAAWSTTAGYGASSLVTITLFCRRSGTPLSDLWRIRWSDIMSYLHLTRDVLRGRAFAAPAVPSET